MNGTTSNAITVFSCPPHCSAGGPQSDGGHRFDVEVDFIRCGECGTEFLARSGGMTDTLIHRAAHGCSGKDLRTTGGSMACSLCGMTAMDWCLMRPTAECEHKLVRSKRNPRIVTCSECSEGTSYLFGHPGSKDAVALGCKCPIDAQLPGLPNGMGWMVSRKCRLHTPDDELEVE